jgi:hypothetical protein
MSYGELEKIVRFVDIDGNVMVQDLYKTLTFLGHHHHM